MDQNISYNQNIGPDDFSFSSSTAGRLHTPDTVKKSSRIPAILVGLMAGIIVSCCVVWSTPLLRGIGYSLFVNESPLPQVRKMASKNEVGALIARVADLVKRCSSLVPTEPYIIINTADNLFVLKKGQKIIRQGNCSTGSFTLLRSPDGKKEWIFQTPRGVRHVLQKTEDPVWIQPDWAFVEEGKPVPPAGSPDRAMYGVLGDYALALGNGYMIHGTLYQRFLGLPVTHGCVRLGDDDLENVFKNLQIGSKVFLY